jgi:transcriptional regulator with XRE-family HTH domain
MIPRIDSLHQLEYGNLLDSKQLGARIAEARTRAGLTQADLADLTGYDQRSISQWERGLRKMPAVDIPRFAEVLDISILEIYAGQIGESDLDAELLQEFHNLPGTEARQTVIRLVRELRRLLDQHAE